MPRWRTEDDILADPETTPDIRRRIEADRYGRALFDGLRRHHKSVMGEPPPKWDEMSSFERGWVWRPAIYDMLAKLQPTKEPARSPQKPVGPNGAEGRDEVPP